MLVLVERIQPVIKELRQALEVVARSHHGHGDRGARLADGANELAAHVAHLGKGVLHPGPGLGNALVALLLAFAQRAAWLGFALDVLAMPQGLEHLTALCAGVAPPSSTPNAASC